MTLSQSDVKALREALEEAKRYANITYPYDLQAPMSLIAIYEKALSILDAQEAAQGAGDFVMVPCSVISGVQKKLASINQLTGAQLSNSDAMINLEAVQSLALLGIEPRDIAALAAASVPPCNRAGDARELADKLLPHCTIQGITFDGLDLITAYTARIHNEAMEECAKIAENQHLFPQANIVHAEITMPLHKAIAKAIRALPTSGETK